MAKKQQSTALTKWDEKLAALAAQATAVEKNVGSGNMISMKGGVLQYKGAEIQGNAFTAVILDHILHNRFYEDKFDPNNPVAPVCFAFGRSDDEMKPHEDSNAPQHAQCIGCPQNEWGTADRGRGKACGNIRRLALLSESDLEDIENAEIAFLHLPVTSVKGWAGYVRNLDGTLHRPPLGVVTEITCVPDAQTQFKVQFKMTSTIDDGAQIEQLIRKAEQAQREIEFPYVQIAPAEPAQPQRRGRNVVPSRTPAARNAAPPPAPRKGIGAQPAKVGKAKF